MTITTSRFLETSFSSVIDGESKRQAKPPPVLHTPNEPPVRPSSNPPKDAFNKSSTRDVIVIDNGSSMLRAGFSNSTSPQLEFPPDVSRYRDRKMARLVTLVGYNAHIDAGTRGQIKKVFEPGTSVVCNWDVMEGCLDSVFSSLGIDDGEDQGIGRDVLMTEAMAGLSYTRKTMNELLFECYGAPRVAYGVDMLFSYKQNQGQTGLIISSSNSASHVVPVQDGRPVLSGVSRLNWGGYHATEYMLKLLRLKYPTFPNQVKDYQAEGFVRDYCRTSLQFEPDMKQMFAWNGMEDRDCVVQYPFTEQIVIEKTQEELDRIAEKKRQGGIRLQEQAAKMRLEKLVQKEQNLDYYKDLQNRLVGQTKKEIKRLLDDDEIKDENQLERMIKDLEKRIRKARNKDLGVEEPVDEEEEQTFPLLEIPDADLDEAGLKQKRHQRLMKSGLEARQRAKLEKEAERARIEALQKEDEDKRQNDLETWLDEKRDARLELLARIKDRDRQTRDQGNRKSLASQMRMKTLANLASDTPSKKRRRGAGGDDDDFGANDDDWGVYRTVATGDPASDEEEEEDLDAEMQKLEQELLDHDPSFTEEHTVGAAKDWTKSLMHVFLHGPRPYDPESQADQNQIHLNVERIRVPEVIFQPSIAGIDQAGIVDIAAGIIDNLYASTPSRYDTDAMLRDVFLTGGNTLFQGFEERLAKDLRTVSRAETPVTLRSARDPLRDAWRGAASWARQASGINYQNAAVSKAEYEEMGSEYMKEHEYGNVPSL